MNKLKIAPGGLTEFLICLLIWSIALINIVPPILKIIDKVKEKQAIQSNMEINLPHYDIWQIDFHGQEIQK